MSGLQVTDSEDKAWGKFVGDYPDRGATKAVTTPIALTPSCRKLIRLCSSAVQSFRKSEKE